MRQNWVDGAAGAFCGFLVHLLPHRVSRLCRFLVTSMYLLLLLQLILMQCDGTVYAHCHPLKSEICQLHLAATVNGESDAQ
jgi:hypothetical protein